ncbi:hypothetical protein SAMN05443253_10595 [Bacillus sp. OK048]|nr:hypothetical protein SAMN05443253_10595 [Bacillus sp. OK048]
MLEEFLIFYAPFLIVILSIAISFWIAAKNDAVEK